MSTPSQEELRADAENGHKALKKSIQNTLQELKNQQKQSAEKLLRINEKRNREVPFLFWKLAFNKLLLEKYVGKQ